MSKRSRMRPQGSDGKFGREFPDLGHRPRRGQLRRPSTAGSADPTVRIMTRIASRTDGGSVGQASSMRAMLGSVSSGASLFAARAAEIAIFSGFLRGVRIPPAPLNACSDSRDESEDGAASTPPARTSGEVCCGVLLRQAEMRRHAPLHGRSDGLVPHLPRHAPDVDQAAHDRVARRRPLGLAELGPEPVPFGKGARGGPREARVQTRNGVAVVPCSPAVSR